jgi:hypothetical protein
MGGNDDGDGTRDDGDGDNAEAMWPLLSSVLTSWDSVEREECQRTAAGVRRGPDGCERKEEC